MNDFDQQIDRRNSHSTKWDKYGRDILPFWIADMDFAVPDFIRDALYARLDHPIIGYTKPPAALTEAFRDGYSTIINGRSGRVVVWLPGVVPGMNMAARCLGLEEKVMIPTPVYYPFLEIADNVQRQDVRVPLLLDRGRWQMDLDRMQT